MAFVFEKSPISASRSITSFSPNAQAIANFLIFAYA
jgi:hypothetical protein